MNWARAVELTSWMSANMAHANPQGSWPRGGWAALGDLPENRGEMLRRIEAVLEVPAHAASQHGAELHVIASELRVNESLRSAPTIDVTDSSGSLLMGDAKIPLPSWAAILKHDHVSSDGILGAPGEAYDVTETAEAGDDATKSRDAS